MLGLRTHQTVGTTVTEPTGYSLTATNGNPIIDAYSG